MKDKKKIDFKKMGIKNPKARKKVFFSLFIVIAIIIAIPLLKKDNPKKPEENFGKIKEEQGLKNKDNIVKVKDPDFNKEPTHYDAAENDYYTDDFGLKYRFVNMPSVGIKTMIPVGWTIDVEDPNFIYIRSNNSKNYKIVEIAIGAKLRDYPTGPNELPDQLRPKIVSRYMFHLPDGRTLYPEKPAINPIDAYNLGNTDKKVWASYDPEFGYREFPCDQKPKSIPEDELVETQEFKAHAYDAWWKFIGLGDLGLTGQLALSHRYMNVGQDMSQFVSVTGPLKLDAKIMEIANTIVKFANPADNGPLENYELTTPVDMGGATFFVPSSFKETAANNRRYTDTKMLSSTNLGSIDTGLNISFFKINFSSEEVKTLNPMDPEPIRALARSLSPVKQHVFNDVEKLTPNGINISYGETKKISSNITKYSNTMLLLRTRALKSVAEYSYGIDFPNRGNLYIIDKRGTSQVYGVFIPYNSYNEKYVNILGDSIVKRAILK